MTKSTGPWFSIFGSTLPLFFVSCESQIVPSSSEVFSQGFGVSLEVGGLLKHETLEVGAADNTSPLGHHQFAAREQRRPAKKRKGMFRVGGLLVWRCNRRSKFISPSRSLIRSSVPFRSPSARVIVFQWIPG
jgi:hypothetical protein